MPTNDPEYRRRHHQEHREHDNERNKAWYYEHKDQHNARNLKRYYENKEKLLVRQKVLRSTDEFAIRHAAYMKSYAMKNRLKLIEALGGKCEKCSIADWRVLEFHELLGNGNRRRDLMGRRTSFFTFWLKHAELRKQEIQLLCANCHRIVTRESDVWSREYKYGNAKMRESRRNPNLPARTN